MEKFENVYVGYMLNQAAMPFFRVGMYPHYTVEEGRVVVDRSEDSETLRSQARTAYALLQRVQSRQKRGMRVPKTWAKQLTECETLVLALEETKTCCAEWCTEFHRTLRWLGAR